MRAQPDLARLLADPSRAAELPVEAVLPLLIQVNAVSSTLAARLLQAKGQELPPPVAPRYVKAKEIARTFDLRLHRVYELARTRRIPYIPMGKRTMRFDVEAVRRALES